MYECTYVNNAENPPLFITELVGGTFASASSNTRSASNGDRWESRVISRNICYVYICILCILPTLFTTELVGGAFASASSNARSASNGDRWESRVISRNGFGPDWSDGPSLHIASSHPEIAVIRILVTDERAVYGPLLRRERLFM